MSIFMQPRSRKSPKNPSGKINSIGLLLSRVLSASAAAADPATRAAAEFWQGVVNQNLGKRVQRVAAKPRVAKKRRVVVVELKKAA